jgi:hypothetical protein
MFKRRDLFVDVAEYEGKLANILLTKSAPIDSIDIQPYLDSLFFHFDGMDGYEYLQSGSSLEDFLRSVDSLDLDPNFNFLDFFRSLKAWYSVYRFSSAINDEYHILNLDTLFIGLNIKFKYTGERFPDETINTQQGNFDCKKFLISWKVSLQIFQWMELLSTKDTVWIAPGNWIVQEIVPTNHIVLPSLFGIDPVSIPGLYTGNPLVVSVEDELAIPNDIALKQNYPNPFNPSTKIEYRISDIGFVSLKIYDILGNEIATLVNEEKPAGTFRVDWNASKVPSGVYFYQLKTDGFVETKKMMLMK